MQKRTKKLKDKDVYDPHLLDTLVRTLPEGKYEGVTIVVPYSRNAGHGRFAVINGRIYTLGNMPFDLAEESRPGLNDSVRRIWCRLAGVSMSDLQYTIRTKRQKWKEEANSDEVRDLQEQAHRLGYRLERIPK